MVRHVVEVERRLVDRYPAEQIADAETRMWGVSVPLLVLFSLWVVGGWFAYTGALQAALDAHGRWAWWTAGATSLYLIAELVDGCGEFWRALRAWSVARRHGRKVLALPMSQRVVAVPVYVLTEGPLGVSRRRASVARLGRRAGSQSAMTQSPV